MNAPPFVVPRDCFQDKTYPPELKAAKQLKLLVTMVAVRVVLAQEEGFGNECHDDPSYTELHDDLTTFLSQNPLGKLWDGEWLEKVDQASEAELQTRGGEDHRGAGRVLVQRV